MALRPFVALALFRTDDPKIDAGQLPGLQRPQPGAPGTAQLPYARLCWAMAQKV